MYLAAVESIEANTKKTKTIHLNHMRRLLGEGTPLDTIRQSDVQSYAKARRKEKFQGKQTEGYTIRKELRTFRQVWEWACSQGYPTVAPTWTVEAVDLPKDQGREPFRTFDQIQQIVTKGGLSAKDEARHWETLFLNGGELQDLLAYVQENATASWVYPMVSFVALTGCRRSEAVRSQIDDWDIASRRVRIREKKRDTTKLFTTRQVDLHPHLVAVVSKWFGEHPGGQFAFTSDGEPLTVDQATDHFRRTLRGGPTPHPKWSKVPGFHTLRHSVASILASKGVDQRYIDKIIGHHTDEMRKRYQHLSPRRCHRCRQPTTRIVDRGRRPWFW